MARAFQFFSAVAEVTPSKPIASMDPSEGAYELTCGPNASVDLGADALGWSSGDLSALVRTCEDSVESVAVSSDSDWTIEVVSRRLKAAARESVHSEPRLSALSNAQRGGPFRLEWRAKIVNW